MFVVVCYVYVVVRVVVVVIYDLIGILLLMYCFVYCFFVWVFIHQVRFIGFDIQLLFFSLINEFYINGIFDM